MKMPLPFQVFLLTLYVRPQSSYHSPRMSVWCDLQSPKECVKKPIKASLCALRESGKRSISFFCHQTWMGTIFRAFGNKVDRLWPEYMHKHWLVIVEGLFVQFVKQKSSLTENVSASLNLTMFCACNACKSTGGPSSQCEESLLFFLIFMRTFSSWNVTYLPPTSTIT